jgi:hypothetical protein
MIMAAASCLFAHAFTAQSGLQAMIGVPGCGIVSSDEMLATPYVHCRLQASTNQ